MPARSAAPRPKAPSTGPHLHPAPLGDVLEVSAAAGGLALARLAQSEHGGRGPVTVCGGRMAFRTAPGTADRLPELLTLLDWDGVPLDLRGHPGRGDASDADADALRARCPLPHACGGAVGLPGGGEPPDLDLASPGRGLLLLVTALADACLRVALAPPLVRVVSPRQACACS